MKVMMKDIYIYLRDPHFLFFIFIFQSICSVKSLLLRVDLFKLLNINMVCGLRGVNPNVPMLKTPIILFFCFTMLSF